MLTLYSKPGCHLCEELRALLDELQPEFGYHIQEIDITTEASLYARYRHEIPVLFANEQEIGRGRIAEADLRARLRQLKRRN